MISGVTRAAACAAALLLVAAQAQAQDAAERVSTAFTAAEALERQGRLTEALARYAEADAAERAGAEWASASLAASSGGLLLRLGRPEAALARFAAYIEHARAYAAANDWEPEATPLPVLLGMAGAHARLGAWEAAARTLREAGAHGSATSEMRAAVERARTLLTDARTASGPERRANVLRMELALAGAADRDFGYPVAAAALAVELGSVILAGGAYERASTVLEGAAPGWSPPQDCAAEAARLLVLADLAARGPQRDELRAAAYYDSAAATPAAARASADLPPGTLRFPSDTAVHEPWAFALLRLEAETGPRAARMNALAAAEHRRARAAVETLWGNDPADEEERSCGNRPRLRLNAGAVADSLAAAGEGALAWLAGADTLVTWLILPTGEVEVARVAARRAAVMRAIAQVRPGTPAAKQVTEALLPPPLRALLPPAARLVIAAPPELGDGAGIVALLAAGPLSSYQLDTVSTLAEYVTGERPARAARVALAATPPPDRVTSLFRAAALASGDADVPGAAPVTELAATATAFGAGVIAAPAAVLVETLGDSLAAAVLLGDSAARVHALPLVRRAAQAAASAGRHDAAARLLEQVAELLVAGRAAKDRETALAAAAALQDAALQWAQANEPARQAAALRAAAVRLADWGAPELREARGMLYEAFELQAATQPVERMATLLALETVERFSGRTGAADTALLAACSWQCGAATAEGARVFSALQQEIARDPSGTRTFSGVRAAARNLLGELVVTETGAAPPNPLVTRYDARYSLEAAVDSAQARGDTALEATLRHALGDLRARPDAARIVDTSAALEELATAAALRAASGDASGVMSSIGQRAMVHLARIGEWRGALDSARADIAAAEQVAQGASEAAATAPGFLALRSQLRRRHAQVEAAAGNAEAAERLLAEALALRGDSAVFATAADRFWVARQYVQAGHGARALAHAGMAFDVFAAAARTEPADPAAAAMAARAAELLAAGHSLEQRPDSAAHWLALAATRWHRLNAAERRAHALAARAETLLEAARLDDAAAALDSAAAAAAERPAGVRPWAWPGDALAARLANDLGLLHIAHGDDSQASALFAAAKRLAPISHPETLEAERNSALTALASADVTDADSIRTALAWAGSDWRAGGALEPPRPPRRPLTRGWVHMHFATLHARSSDLAALAAAIDSALPLVEEAGHRPSVQQVLGAKAWLFQQLGRADSAHVYFSAAGEPGAQYAARVAAAYGMGDVATDRAALNPFDGLRTTLARAAPEQVDGLLAPVLAEARRTDDALAEARVYEAYGWYDLRVRTPADPAAATAWYDSAAAALGRVGSGLDDWQRVQLGEQFTRVQHESALAWLARARELGPENAAAGALAAADRGRGQAFEALARTTARSARPRRLADAGWWLRGSMPEVGRTLLRGEALYLQGATTLTYLPTPDTLLVWLHLPTGELLAHREPLGADSLALLVSRARLAMGVDSAGTRNVDRLEDNPLAALLSDDAVPPVQQALRELAAVLLPPALDALLPPGGDLLVVASGPAAAVPFAALPTRAAGEQPLSARFGVRYAPSLHALTSFSGVLAEAGESMPIAPREWHENPDSMRAARRAWLARAVVVGNPTMPVVPLPDGSATRLPTLPAAEREADSVAALLGTEPITRAAATLATLRPRLADATVVHLATHGFAYAREARVGDSFVALAPGPTDDGVLTVDELLADTGPRLGAANLVVLSACQTGLGQMTESEGTLGLQRAFMAIGARSVLVSLWSVSDEATALLLSSFYRHWLEDEDTPGKAEALRRAQEDLRSVPAYSHPRFWAAFQLVGAT